MTRDPKIFGSNLRHHRVWRGWSTERLSQESGISRRTITRIEGGEGCSPATEEKLCRVLSIQLGTMWTQDLAPKTWDRLIGATEGRWKFLDLDEAKKYYSRLKKAGLAPEILSGDPDSIQDPCERIRLGRNGTAQGFQRPMSTSLTEQRHVIVEIELYGRHESPSPGKVSFMNYVLAGEVRFGQPTATYDAGPGDAYLFEARSMWWMQPLGATHARILHVCLSPQPLLKGSS